MALIDIKKEGVKNFGHYWNKSITSIDKYRSNDYGIQSLNGNVLFVKESGAPIFLKTGFAVSDIGVYDIGGLEETFTNSIDLFNRLIELGYNAFFEDGDQDLSLYALKSNVLELNNTTAFTPDADYEPATKKYVDDNAGGGSNIIDRLSTVGNIGASILDLDFNLFEGWSATLTENVSLSISNPRFKVVTLNLTGNFSIAYDFTTVSVVGDDYDGTIRNVLTIHYVSPTDILVIITNYPL